MPVLSHKGHNKVRVTINKTNMGHIHLYVAVTSTYLYSNLNLISTLHLVRLTSSTSDIASCGRRRHRRPSPTLIGQIRATSALALTIATTIRLAALGVVMLVGR